MAPGLLPSAGAAQDAAIRAEVDALWAEVSRTVAEGDFEGYSAVYHPDAVLVSAGSSASIAQALQGWAPGFEETRSGRMGAQVTFRFTDRRLSGTTAHETGIFRYVAHPAGGEPSVSHVHFEALSVKRGGRWLMVMEYQKAPATEAEWEAAAR